MPSSDSGDSCQSDVADFLDDLALSSEDEDGGALSLPPPEPSAATTRIASQREDPSDCTDALQQRGSPEEQPRRRQVAPPVPAAAAAAAATAAMAAAARTDAATIDDVLASFRRSDPHGDVVAVFQRVPRWSSAEVQASLWSHVLITREADGPGSCEYICRVIKALVSVCDRERLEVADILLEKLLLLRAAASARRAASESSHLEALSAAPCEGELPPAADASHLEPEPEPELELPADVASVWADFNARMRRPRPKSLEPPSGTGSAGGTAETPTDEPWLRVADPLPPLPTPAALAQGLATLTERYPLTQGQITAFRRNRYIRLKDVIPAPVLAAAREEIISIVLPATGGINVSGTKSGPWCSPFLLKTMIYQDRLGTNTTKAVKATIVFAEPPPGSAAATQLQGLAPGEIVRGDAAKSLWEGISIPGAQRPCLSPLTFLM